MQHKKTKKITLATKRLQDYLESNKTNLHELSLALPCNYSMIWNWSKGNRRPDLDWAIRLEKFTEGYIPCKAWEIISEKTDKPKKKTK